MNTQYFAPHCANISCPTTLVFILIGTLRIVDEIELPITWAGMDITNPSLSLIVTFQDKTRPKSQILESEILG
jgi:hypothetical protein